MSTAEISLKVQALQNIALFADLTQPVLEQLASELEEITAQKDQVIIRKGEPGESMFLVARGAVIVHDEDRVLATLIAGEYFGEYALIDSYTRSASVTATQPTVLLKLTREGFNAIMDQHPSLNDIVLKELIKRLRNLNSIQDQLIKSNKEIKEQKKEIEQTNAHLAEVNEEKTHIMQVLAHELRNTLTSSITISEALQEELLERTPDLVEHVQRLTKSLWRMSDRIDRILSVRSRLPQNRDLDITEFSIREIMGDLKQQFSEMAATKGVKLIFKIDPFLVSLDRGYTRQILENLIGNALKFSTAGKKVLVRTQEYQGQLAISVTDQGPGLSEEALKPLKGPLNQEEVIVKNASDLSLAIVRKFTESMGGTVSCKSKPGKGACFTLQFKQYKKEVPEKGFWDIFKS